MSRRKENKTCGFTLVEVVIASMLMGMILLVAFPLITTGRNVVKREQREVEAGLLGDGVFERVFHELQSAGRIFLGTEEELKLAYGDTDEWEKLKIDLSDHGLEPEIFVMQVEREWVRIHVMLMEDESVLYEREAVVPLLNLGFSEEKWEETSAVFMAVTTDDVESDTEEAVWYLAVE